jgi:hypothetical protein
MLRTQPATGELLTQNKQGFQVVLTSTGASIQKMLVPSCSGKHRLVNVALG